MLTIQPGTPVFVETALGERLQRRAISAVVQGHAFSVVWVCREEEWEAAHRESREPDGVPFPAEDVVPSLPA
ncbi:MAG TPA: hypothetical protein VMV09_00575 [Candidatus Saccharimonadales bacterium]|nr:hypothetical protein [Candidatus Saccharimonadales bacterium]